jgi:hypothetical protein
MHDELDARTAETTAEAVDAACRENGWEWHAEIVCASGCCWQAKLTVVLTPDNPDGPDRALVTLACAGAGPDDALAEAWADMQTWLAGPPASYAAGRAAAIVERNGWPRHV